MIARLILPAALLFGGAAQAQTISSFYPPSAATAVAQCAETTIPAGANVVNTSVETTFAVPCRVPAGSISAGTVLHVDTRFRLSVNAVVLSLRGKVYLARSSASDVSTCVAASQCLLVLDTGSVTGLAAGTGLYGNSDVSFTFQSPTTVESSGQLNFQTTAQAVIAISAQSAGVLTVPWDTNLFDTYVVYSATWSQAQNNNSIQMRQQTLK